MEKNNAISSTSSPLTKGEESNKNNNDEDLKRKREPSPEPPPSSSEITMEARQTIQRIPSTSSTPVILHCLYEDRKWKAYLYVPSQPSSPIIWSDITEHYCKILISKLFFYLGEAGYITINTIVDDKYEKRYQFLKQKMDILLTMHQHHHHQK